MHESFKYRPSRFRLGMTATSIFLIAQVGSVVAMYFDAPPDRRLLAVLIFGVAWSPFVGLGLWTTASSLRESITIDDRTVRFTGVLTSFAMDFDQIALAHWLSRPFSLKLATASRKQKIRFGDFRPADRRRLMQVFRQRLSGDVQQGWNEDLEREMNLPSVHETVAQFNLFYRKLFVTTLACGPLFGMGCGLYLRLNAGAEVESTIGLLVGWGLLGLVVSVGFCGLLWYFKWMSLTDFTQ